VYFLVVCKQSGCLVAAAAARSKHNASILYLTAVARQNFFRYLEATWHLETFHHGDVMQVCVVGCALRLLLSDV
jgi:hypothetical protein